MQVLHLLFLVLSVITTSQGSVPYQVFPLRLRSGSDGEKISGIDCLSWRLAVETHNLRNFGLVPSSCENYMAKYMLGGQYSADCFEAASAAYEYAKNLTLADDGKDIWIFDIDETALSSLPFYSSPDNAFGTKEYNDTSFKEWEKLGVAPALPAILDLYNKLLDLGFKIVFLSGKSESIRDIAEQNLKDVGYHTWEKLILKQTSEKGSTAVVYKSKKRTELVNEGYRILGNVGDQWSDLLGDNVGNRTFKVPDPLFYLP
ncbi:hypothetical protein L6164_033147 [Bauhinia variegata]|uniref:Uncharacterized protein n=1 Tax=Bauhinia variegata TaxID=167791 RepID=A0ACB9KQZ3_BAUVA|nr:hypothetical protein L6164_033147 [Bauhinia variegata]